MLVHKAFTQSRTNAGTVLFDCMLIYQSNLHLWIATSSAAHESNASYHKMHVSMQ